MSEFCYYHDCLLSSMLEEEVMECPLLTDGGCAACHYFDESFAPCSD